MPQRYDMGQLTSIFLAAAIAGAPMSIFERAKAGLRNSARAGVRVIAKAVGYHYMFDRIPAEGSGGERLTAPYKNSVWVQRAIKKVAQPISAVPLRFGTSRERGSELKDPALTDWWRMPALGMKTASGKPRLLSFADFVEATIGWIKLKGEAFWLLDDTTKVPFPEARPNGMQWPKLIIARPDRMRPNFDGMILRNWDFTDGAGQKHTLEPDNVVHIPAWNPYDDVHGLDEMTAAFVAAEADYLAGLYNRNLMQNNGDRGPFVTFDGQASDEQIKQVTAQLREKRMAALRGEYKAVFLNGHVTVEDPKAQLLDAALVAQRLENRHEIAIAFGVPPSMFDVVASYSIGSASDRYMLIEETCIPHGTKLEEHIAQVARRMLGREDIVAWLDWDEHSTMQQVRAERIVTADKLAARGVPMKQISEYLRLNLPEHPGWEIGYLPATLVPVGENGMEIPDPATDPAFAEDNSPPKKPKESDGAKMIRDAFGRAEPITERELFEQMGFVTAKDRPARELALWRAAVAPRRATMKAYESAFTRTLMEARKETLVNFDKLIPASWNGQAAKAAAVDVVFDVRKFARSLGARFKKVAIAALDAAGKQVFGELERDDPWETPATTVLNFLKERESKIVGISQDLFDDVRGAIDDGFREGAPRDKIAEDIRAVFTDASKSRAKTIAQTETAVAYGQGRHVAMKQAGVVNKQWLTSGNENVRDAHAAANGQIVPLDTPFDVGGEDLMFPGDPDGSPENVINCHCVQIALPGEKEDENV